MRLSFLAAIVLSWVVAVPSRFVVELSYAHLVSEAFTISIGAVGNASVRYLWADTSERVLKFAEFLSGDECHDDKRLLVALRWHQLPVSKL